ncbi:hypothetical protein ACFX4I_01150 [Peribacillus sp. YIM B13472]|uniref:hypothetical protein n=1 Tax=Peribacillus sp. YIM B13472 TaxID=3366297 RepID=UPI003670EA8B
MGDIKTHALVSFRTIQQLQNISPDEDWIYLELGNFLTDISQYRDPFAHMSAKKKVWRRALFSTGIPILGPPSVALGLGRVQSWMDDLLGSARPGKNRYGALAEYFRYCTLFVTHELFANNSGIDLLLKNATSPNPHSQIKLVSVDEVNRVFHKFYTQYYPHEHIDFPPYLEGEAQRKHAWYQRGQRGLIGYIEEQIAYLSEELTKLELRWLEIRKYPPSHQERRDVLVRFGHLLHSIEDYYFHSNFIETLQWTSTTSSFPFHKYEREDDKWFLLKSAYLRNQCAQSPLSFQTFNLLFRKFIRRLRYPIFTDDGTGDETRSLDSKMMIYTGGFAENDMYHTIYESLIQIEQGIRKLPFGMALLNSELVLFRLLFNESERIKMVKQTDYMDEMETQHKKQLLDGQYHLTAKKWRELELITPEGERALVQAFTIDQNLQTEYSTPPGVGGFLIMVLKEMQVIAMLNAKKVAQLNTRSDSVKNEATSNRAFSEMIGTHTLLAKDTNTEGPCREEALALAKFASSAVACKLYTRIVKNSDDKTCIDWEFVLRHYLRFPNSSPNSWESTVLTALRNGTPIPTYDEVADKDKFNMLSDKDPRLKQQLQRNTRHNLEQRYTKLEKKVES